MSEGQITHPIVVTDYYIQFTGEESRDAVNTFLGKYLPSYKVSFVENVSDASHSHWELMQNSRDFGTRIEEGQYIYISSNGREKLLSQTELDVLAKKVSK